VSTLISLDCEANGLHGQIFAVAAVLYDDGREVDRLVARCPIVGDVDPWVVANVLPAIADLPVRGSGTYEWLLYRWRGWYSESQDKWPGADGRGPAVLCHVAWPIETRFLWDAHRGEPFSGPFPLLDVASTLDAYGHDPTSVDGYLRSVGVALPAGSPHHPLYDARAAALAYLHLRRNLPA
jgi:DNA polymerase III epsilon subunit-like protein